MASATIYASEDAQVGRANGNESWATIRDSAGTALNRTGTTANTLIVTNAGVFFQLYRSIFIFDLSALPDHATISAITLSLYGTQKETHPSYSPTLNLYDATPASTTTLVAADYSTVGTTAYATAKTYAAFDDSGYNAFALNSAGIAAAQAAYAAGTKFSVGAREATYDAADNEPTVYGTDVMVFQVSTRDQSGTGQDPKIVVTYTVTFTATLTTSMGLVASIAGQVQGIERSMTTSVGLVANIAGVSGSADWLCVASKDGGSVKTKSAVGASWTVLAEDGAENAVSSAHLAQFDNRLVSIAYQGAGFAYSQWYAIDGAVWTHIDNYPNWPQRFTDLFVDKDADNNPRLCFLTPEGMFYLQEPFSEFAFGPTEVNWEYDVNAGKVALYKWGYTHIAVHKSIFQTKAGVTTLIGPDRDDGLPTDLQGVITDMIGVGFWLVIAVDGGAGHKSCILKKYLSGNHWQPVYVGSANTPIQSLMWDSGTLFFGEGEDVKSLPLPAVTDNYTLDETYDYSSSGTLFTPWFHSEFESMTKVAHRVRAVTQDCNANETLTVSYRKDAETDWTELGVFNTSPTDDALKFASGVGLEFERIQFKVDFARGSTTTNSPKLERLIIDYTVHPPILWAWTVRVKAHEMGDYSGADIISTLKTAMETNTLMSFYPDPTEDSKGTLYLVQVSGMPGNEQLTEHGQEAVYLLSLNEVT